MWSTEQILLAIVAILIAYYLFFVWDPRYFSRLGLKGPTPVPFFGNMISVLRKGFADYSVEAAQKYGRVAGAFEGTVPMLLVSDPDVIQQILIKDFNSFPNRKAMKPGCKVMDNFLTTLEGEHWRHVRHVLTPAFSTVKLKQMMPDINDCAKLFVNNMRATAKEGRIVNMKDCCGQYTMDVVARNAFGIEVDTQSNPNSPFVVNARKLFDFSFFSPTILIFFFFPFFRPVLRYFGFSLLPQKSMDFFRDVVIKAFEGRSEDKERRPDLLQLMVNAYNEQKAAETKASESNDKSEQPARKGLTEVEVVSQSVLFFLAGYETTASTLSFIFYNLAMYPDCQEKLYNEVLRVVGDKAEIDFDTANSLTYMEQCIQETLRLYPPFMRTDRQAVVDAKVGDIPIPKGNYVAIQIYALHHDPLYWPDPEKFDPDRFSPEAVASHHPVQYLPFSQGPRICIGMRLAQLELKVAVAYIIRHCRFVRCPETQVPLTFRANGFLQTKIPIKLKVELRS